MPQYVRIVKNILNENKHENLELLGYRDNGMAKLTQVVNVLTSWGYVNVVKIKTRPDPALKIIVRRAADFQEKFDAFAKVLELKRLERQKAKAEEQDKEKDAKDDKDDKDDKEETSAPAEATKSDETQEKKEEAEVSP